MSIPIQAISSVPSPWRFEGLAAVGQPGSVSSDPSVLPEAGFDGHVKVPAYFALWLELLELMQQQRAADRALSSKVGLVTQDMSRAQAQHVRDEGTKIFAGALAGAAMGLAVGAAGAVISHRAFGRQAGGPATVERPASGSAARSIAGDDDVSRPARPYRDDLSELSGPSEWRQMSGVWSVSSRSASSRSVSSRSASESGIDDIASPSSWLDRLQMRGFGRTYQFNADGPSSRGSAEIPGHPDAAESVRLLAVRPLDSMPSSSFTSRAGSVRSMRSVDSAGSEGSARSASSISSTRSEEAVRGEAGATNDWGGGPAGADIEPPRHPGPPGATDPMHFARQGMIGQMLAANAGSLAAVGASGGQMAAAMDRADAGLLQTSGMISESTKQNRGEEARNGNEAAGRALAALRDQNQDLRQTVSQIVSSIRA